MKQKLKKTIMKNILYKILFDLKSDMNDMKKIVVLLLMTLM